MSNNGYQITFSNADNVSPWGGLALWSQFLRGIKFRNQLTQWPLPQPGSNRGYDPTLLVEQFVTNVLCGANRLSHLNTLRLDKTVAKICDWPQIPEQKAFSRFFKRFRSPADSASLMEKVYGAPVRR